MQLHSKKMEIPAELSKTNTFPRVTNHGAFISCVSAEADGRENRA